MTEKTLVRFYSVFLNTCLILASSLGVGYSAFAVVYPKHEAPNMDLIYLEDPMVDLAVRDKLIREAKYSVKMVSFSATADATGAVILKALRAAQDRGVKVQSIFEKSGNVVEGDFSNDAERLLADAKLKCLGDVMCIKTWDKIKSGLFLDDFVHEKILIIDEGTRFEKIIVGGRNSGRFALDFGDAAFLLRPIDSTKSWAGKDIGSFYQRLWNALSGLFRKSTNSVAKPKALARLAKQPDLELKTTAQRSDFATISRLLDTPPRIDDGLEDFQFRPKTFQMASNDLLMKAVSSKAGYSMKARAELKDDTLELMHSLIQDKNKITLSTYAVSLPKTIEKDLMDHVGEGKSLEIVTNGRNAYTIMNEPYTFSRMVAHSAADYTLRSLIPILESGENKGGQVRAYLLDPKKDFVEPADWKAPNPYKYLHRKVLILDDIVGLGSHNITKSSEMKNDEVVFFLEDERMAAYLRDLIHREVKLYYHPVDAAGAKEELHSRTWYSDCLQFFVQRAF